MTGVEKFGNIVKNLTEGVFYSKKELITLALKEGVGESYIKLYFSKCVVNNQNRRFTGIGADLLWETEVGFRKILPDDLKHPDYVGAITNEEISDIAKEMTQLGEHNYEAMPLCENKIFPIVGCTSSKNFTSENDTMKVGDVYDGYEFSTIKNTCIETESPYLVMSTKYGLITPSDLIQNYNLALSGLSNQNIAFLKRKSKVFDLTLNLIDLLDTLKFKRCIIPLCLSSNYLSRIDLDRFNRYLHNRESYALLFTSGIDPFSRIKQIGAGREFMKKYGGESKKKANILKKLMFEDYNNVFENISSINEKFL